MSSPVHVLFCFLGLTLSLSGGTLGQSQSSDEETLRRMTEQYGLAIAAGDLEAMRLFWTPQSPNLASRLPYYRRLFSDGRIEFIRMNVTMLEITNERAVSHLTSDERRLDRKTGGILTDRDFIHGACRWFEWIKTGGGWKLEREGLLQDEVAARLEAAASEQERNDILEKEKAYVNDTLIMTLATRGSRNRLLGDSDAALRCFELEQAVAEKIGDGAGVAASWLNRGLLKDSQDDPEQALPMLQKALELYEAVGLDRGVAVAFEKLGKVLRWLGDHRRAFECLQKALRLYEETYTRRRMADALTEMAYLYGSQQNYQQALAYLERALAISEEVGDTIHIAILRHDIANNLSRLGDRERALEIYQELLKQTESGDPAAAAILRDQIGRVFAAHGKYGDALNYFNQALAQHEASNQKSGTVIVLIDLSDVYLSQGKYADALPLTERAVSLSHQTGQHVGLWMALTFRGYCQVGLNRPMEARQSFAEAVSVIEKLRTQTAGGVEESQRSFQGGLRAHHGLLSLLVNENQPREALVLAERTKARALLDMLQQGPVSVQKAMTAEEQDQERRLKSELTQLNRQLARATQPDAPDGGRITEIEPRLEKARLNYEAFQNSLFAAHPELKVQRGEAPIINAEELAALLPDATSALLEYVVTDDKTYFFIITKEAGKAEAEVRVHTLPIKREDLARQTEAFRRQLAGRDLGFRASAVKLYELLLKPAAAQLRGKTNLVIAPDDTLWDLPFQALQTGANRFLIEDAAIAYAPSLTVLREMTRRRTNYGAAPATLLALGNPRLGKGTVSRAMLAPRDEKIEPLPEAEQEVKALGRLYGMSKSKVYIGSDAREERVKSEAGQARILHFATHGMLNNASPMYSHLALAAGSANEDGLLEAWELMQLDLKADLAVLSACETARGRFGAGEGMIGLSWAMFIAGVPSTVVSQWKVESAGTRDLMVNFHRGLISPPIAGRVKPTKSEALRQAALKLMKNPETHHPFYWGGFVLVGDGR